MSPVHVIPVTLMLALMGGVLFQRFRTPALGTQRGLKGKTGRIVIASIFLTLAYLLVWPPVYYAVDSVMPFTNATDLLAKLCAMAAVTVLANHLRMVYISPCKRRRSAAAAGLLVFTAAAGGLLWSLLATDGPRPSPQLMDYASQPSVRVNTWLVLLYIAYLVIPFIRPAYLDSLRNPLTIGRIGSGLIAGGFALSLLRAGSYPVEWYGPAETASFFMLVSYVSSACVVVGIALFACARRKRAAETELGSALSLD